MALSHTNDNVKMYQDSHGDFVPLLIRWNKHTRAWHVHSNTGTLHLRRATIIPTPKGYLMTDKTWDYDPTHPEKIAFYKTPRIEHTKHSHLTAALLRFALTLG